jgi:hypothetical protein
MPDTNAMAPEHDIGPITCIADAADLEALEKSQQAEEAEAKAAKARESFAWNCRLSVFKWRNFDPRQQDQLRKFALDIRAMDRAKLLKTLKQYHNQPLRLHTFLLHCECSRRGIAPSMRGLGKPPAFINCREVPTAYDLISLHDAIAADLEWIVSHYPRHRFCKSWAAAVRTEGIGGLLARAWVYREKRAILIKLAALSELQQWECHVLRGVVVTERNKRIEAQRKEVADCLTWVPKARVLKPWDYPETILPRWVRIWELGIWPDDSPTETARLYQMATAEKMSRQAAAKLLKKIRAYLAPKRRFLLWRK